MQYQDLRTRSQGEEEGDAVLKKEMSDDIKAITAVIEKVERFQDLIKPGNTKEEQRMEWYTMEGMLIVCDVKSSRAAENYRQYVQRRLGAFLAVTLSGTTETGQPREVTEMPSYAFSVTMRRVHRAGTGLRLLLLGVVQSMQGSNISSIKETAELCSSYLSFNSMSALLVVCSTLISPGRQELVRLAAAMESSGGIVAGAQSASSLANRMDTSFPFSGYLKTNTAKLLSWQSLRVLGRVALMIAKEAPSSS